MKPTTVGASLNMTMDSDRNSRSYMHPGAAGLSRFANSVAVRGGHSQLDCSNRVNSQWSDDSGHEWSQNLLDRPMSSYNKKGEKPSGKEYKTVRKFLIKFRLKENHLIWINDLYICLYIAKGFPELLNL